MKALAGRPRKLTDEGLRRIVEWKPLKQVIREAGICQRWGEKLRAGYQHKQRSR